MEIPKIKYLGEMGLDVPTFNVNGQLTIENVGEILDGINQKIDKNDKPPLLQIIEGTKNYDQFLRFIIVNTEYSNNDKFITFPCNIKLQDQDFKEIENVIGFDLSNNDMYYDFEQKDYNFYDGGSEYIYFLNIIHDQDKEQREYLLKFVEFEFDYQKEPEGHTDEIYIKVGDDDFFIYHTLETDYVEDVQELLLKYQE